MCQAIWNCWPRSILAVRCQERYIYVQLFTEIYPFNTPKSDINISSQLYSILFYFKEQCNIANHIASFIKKSYMFRSQHNVPKQYHNAIHIYWTYIAFSVLGHSSVQCVVIQQLAATELFCTAQCDVYWYSYSAGKCDKTVGWYLWDSSATFFFDVCWTEHHCDNWKIITN